MSVHAFQPDSIRFEHHLPVPGTNSTLGIGEENPRFSWRLNEAPKDFEQREYEIELRPGSGKVTSTTSCRFQSPASTLVSWPKSNTLKSGQGYHVRVKVHGQTTDSHEVGSEWSDWNYVEAGYLSRQDWICRRISAPASLDSIGLTSPKVFRKVIEIKSTLEKARLYITAQGVYEFQVNDKVVSNDFMNPGWTCYDRRLTYQVYDLSNALKPGKNVIAISLAEGWFTGRLSWGKGIRNFYGDRTSLMCQIDLRYSDNSSEMIVSDGTWKVFNSACQSAEIYDGESCDGTQLELFKGWLEDHSGSNLPYEAAEVLSDLDCKIDLTAMDAAPMRPSTTLSPVQIIMTPSDKSVLDFGQNLVGHLRVKHVKGPRGSTITFRHAEVMENHELGVRPLRTAKATDSYTLAGLPDGETWAPSFTLHGFRYVQVDGWPNDTTPNITECIEAVVIHTDMTETGKFECSNSNLNQLHSNILWSTKGNFTSLPTDCPQRDERLGWTGDIALFAPTATFLYDCIGILKSWMKDVWIDQQALGGLPALVTPNVLQTDAFWSKVPACAIWNDVVILAPWALYHETGDVQILQDQYESMQSYLSHLPLDQTYTRLWNREVFQLGDWLDPLAPPDRPHISQTDSQLVSNAFLVRSLGLMTKIAATLGKSSDVAHYSAWHEEAKAQFQNLYITPAGNITSDSQTAYALAIVFDLFQTERQRLHAGDRLAHLIRRNNFLISTGFAGTPYVLEALVLTNQTQVAYRMLLETRCPSWLYPITMGATSTWERWDSMTPDGKVNPGEMTSFNHYALGAVGTFLHERVGGLRCLEPGWTKCRVEPIIGGGITSCKVSHLAIHGKISVEWKVFEDEEGHMKCRLQVTVPVGTEVEVAMPSTPETQFKTVGAGTWDFQSSVANYDWPPEAVPVLPKGYEDREN